VFPWIGFFCLGILIGRNLEIVRKSWRQVILSCFVVLAICDSLAPVLNLQNLRSNPITYITTSMPPFDRGMFYTLSTAAIATIAFLVICQVAERFQHNRFIVHLRRSGQITLSLYLLHVLVFYIFVDWSHLITPTGLDTALIFAGIFWVFAITIASWWQHHFGQGPAERLYRAVGG
jgi:uncharacterized membrane protein YeiB